MTSESVERFKQGAGMWQTTDNGQTTLCRMCRNRRNYLRCKSDSVYSKAAHILRELLLGLRTRAETHTDRCVCYNNLQAATTFLPYWSLISLSLLASFLFLFLPNDPADREGPANKHIELTPFVWSLTHIPSWPFLRDVRKKPGKKSAIFTSAKEIMFLPVFVCLWVHAITRTVMDGSFWNFDGMSGMA